MKSFFIIILSLYGVCHGLNTRAQQINIRRYTIEDGLVNNDVLNIYQDSQGFIWLCTRGGLSRYDGSRFANYTVDNGLTSDMINDIYEIAPLEFVIAQNSNGPRVLKNGRTHALLPGNNITFNNFYTVNNRLLSTTDQNGVVEWSNGRFMPLIPGSKNSVSRMSILNDSVWLLLTEHNSIQLVNPSLQPISLPAYLEATVAFTDSYHRTWIGTVHGLRLLNPERQPGSSLSFLSLPPAFDLPILRDAYIAGFTEDSQGNYWISTNNGLVTISGEGRARIFSDRDGLPALAVNCVREDREHNIWIGTTLGLAKFSMNVEIKSYALNLTPAPTRMFYWSPVTENNLRIFDGESISNLDLLTGKLTNSFPVDSSGYQLYRLLNEQLLVIKGKNKAILYSGIPGKEHGEEIAWPDRAFGVLTRVDQNNFVGSSGVTLFQAYNGRSTEKLKLDAESFIYALLTDRKKFLWAGTYSNGLFKIRISGKADSLRLKIIDTLAGRLPDRNIRALYADRENELWIGTRYKGIVRLLELPDGKLEIQNYGTQQGLSSDFVVTINRDSAGNIWVGTLQGIDKLIPTGSGYRVFNFGKVNRFFSHVYDIFFLKNSYLLASDYPYVVRIQDKQLDTLSSSTVYITGIYGGASDTIFTGNGEHTRLPYNKAQINFEFSSPQFINEDFTTYSYRLLGGSDTSWTTSGKSHSVYFASLSPGNYSFQVRAIGFNGKWSMPTTYTFIVNTPFWQTTWFVVLILAVAALLVYALYRYRIRQLMRLQLVRNRIATDLHDEIGSNLTNISILSNLSKNNLLQPQKASGFLQRISEEVSSSSQALDDIIWSVNTSHDTLEETAARMRRYAAELFDAANTGYELYLDPAFEEKKLIMEQRRDIYLLYKEAVNNISKHAGAKQVSIHLSIEQNQLHLRIKDDGKGFETGKTTGRHGLQGMKDRVQKWKGRIEIESAPGMGTSIRVWFPVSK